MWAGDQLLWEMRVPGGNDVPVGSTGLDATSASGEFYGRVSYFHAGGIDRPLLITKDGVESVVPRETWRGQFHAGTSPTTGARRDCPVGTQTGCLQIAWPGMQTNAAHSWGGEQPDIRVWYGGLVDGMRDASGQMYMRNRYYDPATGQFTQTDPIGLAGGLNAYGFAAGDPVSYSDPYGLRAKELCCNDYSQAELDREVALARAGAGAALGLAVIAEAGAEGVVALSDGFADGVKRAVNKGRVIVGLLGQLVGMGDPLPRPQGPENDRPRVERPVKRPTLQPGAPNSDARTEQPRSQPQCVSRRLCFGPDE